jgi:pyruvate kinase
MRSEHELGALIEEVEALRRDILGLVEESANLLGDIHPNHQQSARNLLHYIALRSRDLRPLQTRLAAAGLSSLGRAESHVLAAVEAVLFALQRLHGSGRQARDETADAIDPDVGQALLHQHTEAVLGPRPMRGVAIMVTMPSEAAEDYTLVSQLLGAGMDCMRINCAHDSADGWERMITHLRRAEGRHGRQCRVLMDLAGPKIRTGSLEPAPAVVKFRPARDAHGRVTSPARVWLFPEEQPRHSPTVAAASLPVPGDWLHQLALGNILRLTDTRGAERTLRVVAVDPDGCWVESRKTCYVEPGTVLRLESDEASDRTIGSEARIGTFPPEETALNLATGDELIITRPTITGHDAVCDGQGRLLIPAMIGCTAEQVFEDVQAGDRIWFDDGKIAGVVKHREPDRIRIQITRTRARGTRLRSERGINLPDTELKLPALTEKDRQDLQFVARHADMVALSFVNTPEDVRDLRSLLEPFGHTQPAIVLKIETRRGFENLPAMLLEAMKAPRCAVMIARGDLAIECGFERLAEVQEEILWLCEAAHVPVIWATQVLETLAKEGMPSRAEVTDAAMAHRAECVMLNKGPYIVEAVKVLDDIIRRMHGHQAKKTAMLRALRLVTHFRRTRSAHTVAS